MSITVRKPARTGATGNSFVAVTRTDSITYELSPTR